MGEATYQITVPLEALTDNATTICNSLRCQRHPDNRATTTVTLKGYPNTVPVGSWNQGCHSVFYMMAISKGRDISAETTWRDNIMFWSTEATYNVQTTQPGVATTFISQKMSKHTKTNRFV